MAEVHDCFTPTELVLMEDLGFAERGFGWKEVLAGTFDLDGDLPVNPDGGLKAFGHPIGASGLRMMYECWLQLRGEAPARPPHQDRGAGQEAGPDPQPRRPARRVRLASSRWSAPNPAPETQRSRISTVWIPRPARPPITVPLMRMNCRSGPSSSSRRRAVSSPSQRLMAVSTSEPISPWKCSAT